MGYIVGNMLELEHKSRKSGSRNWALGFSFYNFNNILDLNQYILTIITIICNQ